MDFTYKVDVKEILDEIGASVMADAPLDFGQLEVADVTFTTTGPADVDVTISNAGEGLVAYGTIAAPVKTGCARCLCDFEFVLAGEVEGFYTRPGEQAPQDEDAERVDSEGFVDLGPALLAALVIEAPFAPLHDEECKGLCAQCGADLNTTTCGCHDEVSPDHPFAALKGVLESEPNDESGS